MTETDIRRLPLPRRYAMFLGPLVGAAAGCSGFLMLPPRDALVMVGLFATIGLVAGALVFLNDRRRQSAS